MQKNNNLRKLVGTAMLYIGYPAADFQPNPKMSGKRFPIEKTCFDNAFDVPYQTDFFEEAATVTFEQN